MKTISQREAGAIRATNRANMARLPTFGDTRTGIGPKLGPFWPDTPSKVFVAALSGHRVRMGSSRPPGNWASAAAPCTVSSTKYQLRTATRRRSSLRFLNDEVQKISLAASPKHPFNGLRSCQVMTAWAWWRVPSVQRCGGWKAVFSASVRAKPLLVACRIC